MKTVKFNRWTCTIRFEKYSNGRTAIELYDHKTGELVAVATVNVPDQFVPDKHVLIKNYSENSQMYEQLLAQGIVGPRIKKVRISEFVDDVILCELLVNPEKS